MRAHTSCSTLAGEKTAAIWKTGFVPRKRLLAAQVALPPHSRQDCYRNERERGNAVFNTLEEQILNTPGAAPSPGARAIRHVGLFVLSVVVFAALYLAIRLVG